MDLLFIIHMDMFDTFNTMFQYKNNSHEWHIYLEISDYNSIIHTSTFCHLIFYIGYLWSPFWGAIKLQQICSSQSGAGL